MPLSPQTSILKHIALDFVTVSSKKRADFHNFIFVMKDQLLFILLLSSFLFSNTGFAQLIEKDNAKYWQGRMILRMDANFRIACQPNAIYVSEVQDAFQKIGVNGLQKAFPQHGAPIGTKKEVSENQRSPELWP